MQITLVKKAGLGAGLPQWGKEKSYCLQKWGGGGVTLRTAATVGWHYSLPGCDL